VYQRREHVINLFVLKKEGSGYQSSKLETVHGFNIRRWIAHGLELFSVSDLNAEELLEFVNKFEAMHRPAAAT
jgi:anti-sigma factor RsiW